MACEICNKQTGDLRFGVCMDCATAESIIYDGTDMFDQGPENEEPAKTAMEKLKFLIKKGWKKS